LPLNQPTVSHHLKALRDAGVVTSERRGTWVYYRLAPGMRQRLEGAVGSLFVDPVVA
jgi:DNA-binding transcriptional ArsR family regulator